MVKEVYEDDLVKIIYYINEYGSKVLQIKHNTSRKSIRPTIEII